MPYTPWDGRRIGVEMEMNQYTSDVSDRPGRDIPSVTLKRAISRSLERLGLPQALLNDREAGYYHSRGETWDVKTDSSCGWEIASPILTLDDDGHNAMLREVCAGLAAVGPNIDRTCGHHLHIDVSDLHWTEVQRLCWLWARYEPFWHELVLASRRGNGYCGPLCRVEWSDVPLRQWNEIARGLSASSRDSFYRSAQWFPRGAINLGNWWQSGRIEIRLHHGTISYDQIRDWAMLMTALVARVRNARLPEIRPYTPSPREHGFHTYYIWKALGLTSQREHRDIHPGARDLFERISNRRMEYNPGALGVLPYRDREAERIRALAREAGVGTAAAPSETATPLTSEFSWGTTTASNVYTAGTLGTFDSVQQFAYEMRRRRTAGEW